MFSNREGVTANEWTVPTGGARMAETFDELERMDAERREEMLFARLPDHLEDAVARLPGMARHLEGRDLDVSSRDDLARLPVLRKPALMEAQAADPPFGGYVDEARLAGSRVFTSPGPVWEPQGEGADPWGAARALFAAGFRAGDRVLNALSYHMTPGGFILDEGARALGCTVFPGGVGQTEAQVAAVAPLRPVGYTGTPDFLKVILDHAAESGADVSSITKALVSGGALFPSLRAEYAERGVAVMQAYATADLGVIAYETATDGTVHEGMVVNENVIVEIVRPGTDDPVSESEVGEVVVTNFSRTYPLVRFGTGDLSKVLPGSDGGAGACGRTNTRLAGWMGRADQRTKVKGMFVDPKQVAQVVAAHGLEGARLVVTREGERDAMELRFRGEAEPDAVAGTLRERTGLGGAVVRVDELPNDGLVIADERDYEG